MKKSIDIYGIKITIMNSNETLTDCYAKTYDNIIIYGYSLPPSRFLQILLHEIIHIINDKFYVPIWSTMEKNQAITEFIDEQTALSAEIAIDIFLRYNKDLHSILKQYSIEYSKQNKTKN